MLKDNLENWSIMVAANTGPYRALPLMALVDLPNTKKTTSPVQVN